MDRIKDFLAFVRRQHFWILCGVATITGVVAVFMANSGMSKVLEEERRKAETEFKELGDLVNNPSPPNDAWVKAVGEETNERKKIVGETWHKLHVEQKTNDLVWPNISDEFNREIALLGPRDEIRLKLREDYHNYIEKEFPKLVKIVDARLYSDLGTDARGPGGFERGGLIAGKGAGTAIDDHDYKVIWDPTNQQKIEKSLEWQHTPSTLEVRYVQENLWVYQTLLHIIANVNRKATGHYNAKVKEIQTLAIGQDAAAAFLAGTSPGHIMALATSPITGPGPAAAPGQPPGGVPLGIEGHGPAGSGMGLGGVDESARAKQLEEGRYIDVTGKPVTAEASYAAEYRCMPVFLRLVVDQREVPQLLTECANARLLVEVRQFRLNPSKSGGGAVAAASMSMGRPPGQFGGIGPMPGGAPNMPTGDDQGPYDIPIELHGIIYIYNPPDREKLKLSTGEVPVFDAPAAPAATEPKPDIPGAAPPASPAQPPAEGAAGRGGEAS